MGLANGQLIDAVCACPDDVCMPTANSMGPTDPKSRIKSVDAVRGFSLFGVLLVNMYNFGAYSTEWTGLVDRICFDTMHAVFETKSWRLFSVLFGFGFSLQLIKAETDFDGSLRFYVRRLAILFLIGMIHALFYDGDILMTYAILGLMLIPFRRFQQRTLLALAFVLIAVFPVLNMINSLDEAEPIDATVPRETSQTLAEKRENHPYMGSLADVIRENAPAVPPRIWAHLDDAESHLAFFAMFLIGFCIGRSDILKNLSKHLSLVRKLFYWGVGFGAIAAVIEFLLGRYLGYEVFRDSTASVWVQLLGDTLFAYGTTSLALGYAAGIVLLAQHTTFKPALRFLERLGRMALTVYLSGTLLFSTLFYGYGFGQFNRLGPAVVTIFAILFFAIQIVFSEWWLKRFRYGPMEWVWRSLTYLKAQPLRY